MDGHAIRVATPARVVVSSARIATEGIRVELGGPADGQQGGLPRGGFLIAVAGSLPAAPGQKPLRIEADGDVGEWWPAATGRVHAAIDATGSPGQP